MRKSTERALRFARNQYLEQQKQKELLFFAETMAPGGVRGSAFHEASHAVVAELFDFPVEYVSILPNVKRKVVVDGMTGISLASTQLVLNANGVVALSFPFRGFCYHIQGLASVPAERRLGILSELSVAGDVQKMLDSLKAPDEIKLHFAKLMLMIANNIVNHVDVWSAISKISETLLTEHRVTGDAVRLIMRRHVPPSLYVSKEEQLRVNDDIEHRGVGALSDWAMRFFEEAAA